MSPASQVDSLPLSHLGGPHTSIRMAKSKTLTTANVDDSVEQQKLSFIPSGMQNYIDSLGDSLKD